MTPVNLGPEINSIGDEMFPHLSDNGDLYFSSDSYEGFGGLDMFKANKVGENKWGDLENLRYPLNSNEHDFGIIFERNTDRRGLFTSSREGTKGHDDIFNFNIPPVLLKYYVEVTNSETGDPVPGATIKVTAIDTSGGIKDEYVQTTDIDGTILFNEISEGKRYIEHDLIYEVECQKDSFLVRKSKFSTFNLEDNKTFYDPFEVQPVGDKAIDFPEVQYALNKAELLVDTLEASIGKINSKDSLDFLYNTLIDNPTIVIELQAHTDCRGGDDYNQKLSQRRAQSCVDYLISKGIPADRMKAVGYGEDKPKMEGLECDAISSLSTQEEQEAAHQKNRRTQFIVLNFDYAPKDN
jgi:peptidoglycan-associated lipoprotein